MAGEGVETVARTVAPARRGDRDERRDATVRALAAGQDAHCAYCGELLPPLSPRGGRPTPYCPADPERFGQWGAKVISCAMLDEQREIWVRVYGADQPMTQVDVHTLQARTGELLAAVQPVHDEILALRTRLGTELAAALGARDTAENERDAARESARQADADRADAVTRAAQALERAEADRAELLAAQETTAQAQRERDQAVSGQHEAERERDQAVAERGRALDQVTAAHDRVTDLQATLTGERAAALEQLDRLRREEDERRQSLRATLTADHERQLRAGAEESDRQLLALRRETDQRVAALTSQLTSQLTDATRAYGDALGPLHAQLGTLRENLARGDAEATALRQERDGLLRGLAEALGHHDHDTRDTPARQDIPLRRHIASLLPTPPADHGP